MKVAGIGLADARRVGGGDICTAFAARLPTGEQVFAKTLAAAPSGFFAAEARGLEWLRVPDGPPLPRVLTVGDDGLVLEWVAAAVPSAVAARRFGRALAAMHRAGAPGFGADADGFIGPLPLPNARHDDWPAFYAEQRLRPYVDALTQSQRDAVERLCDRLPDLAGPAEPPARIHGDLWSGNLLWAGTGDVWLVDAAAAHGGHRETDLGMLALFGAPYLEHVVAAYDEVAPLAPGWRKRVGLHQLHPLLVHATLFGGGYGERAASLARRLVEG